MKRINIPTVLLAMLAIFVSCSEDGTPGDIGPPGPQGEQGTEGGQGLQGEQGEQGEPGTANVVYSEWFTISQSDWIGLGTSKLTGEIPAPELNQEIMNKGVVLVYFRFGQSETITPLPSRVTTSLYIKYLITASKIGIEVLLVNGGISIDGISPTEYRYVIIPGGIPAGGRLGLDYGDYEAVKAYYGIPN